MIIRAIIITAERQIIVTEDIMIGVKTIVITETDIKFMIAGNIIMVKNEMVVFPATKATDPQAK